MCCLDRNLHMPPRVATVGGKWGIVPEFPFWKGITASDGVPPTSGMLVEPGLAVYLILRTESNCSLEVSPFDPVVKWASRHGVRCPAVHSRPPNSFAWRGF